MKGDGENGGGKNEERMGPDETGEDGDASIEV
jgi:hypothetical protein